MTTVRRQLIGFGCVALVLCVLCGCAMSSHATARTGAPSSAPASTATPLPMPVSPTAVGPLVVTVLATDVPLKEAPDDHSPSVGASFTINGNSISTMIMVSGDLPVLEENVPGVGGRTWTRVRYQGRVGPRDGGTDVDVTGYLRNDLISAPHAPGAPAMRNPTPMP